jgi:glycosyltransferase involved in cell wall biosynthesis
MRIAFLTPEFVTENNTGGGLSNYLNRLCTVLLQMGHEPEVFVVSDAQPAVISHGGMRVERVPLASGMALQLLRPLFGNRCGLRLGDSYRSIRTGLGLSRAMERRHAESPFHAVQSSDFMAAGLFVKRRPGRKLLVRCSWAIDLFKRAENVQWTADVAWQCRLERASIRRADLAYAPSRWVSGYYRAQFGLNVSVIRPPFFQEISSVEPEDGVLPDKFLVHMGSMSPRKGTELIAQALPLAWKLEPELTMVWAGGEATAGFVEGLRQKLGERKNQVICTGPVRKDKLCGIIKRAVAAVLPSRADNLPNTVIESLLLGVPVIGSRGASIDELVEDGASGLLVPIDDVDALAAAMVRAWRGEAPPPDVEALRAGFLAEMEPFRAAGNLLAAIQNSPTRSESAGGNPALLETTTEA